MKKHIHTGLALAAGALSMAHAASVTNYWDMDTLVGGIPTDIVGGVATSENGSVTLESGTYGSAYGGGGNYLRSLIDASGGAVGSSLSGDVFDGANATALAFASDFAVSYWSYDDFASDGDARGPRVFDYLSGTTVGGQLGSNLTGIFNFRLDDDAAGSVLSNGGGNLETLQMPSDAWVHVVLNVSRVSDTAEIFFNGSSVGSYDIAGLTGAIRPSQDLQIGAINGANGPGGIQTAGLDDLAFYDGTLSVGEVAGLAAGSLTPDMIPEPGSMVLLALGALGLVRRRR